MFMVVSIAVAAVPHLLTLMGESCGPDGDAPEDALARADEAALSVRAECLKRWAADPANTRGRARLAHGHAHLFEKPLPVLRGASGSLVLADGSSSPRHGRGAATPRRARTHAAAPRRCPDRAN